ncbi:hypothetical protein BASA81_008910 [Batrachochytrium salamandrivorans]|nr:hypothetical protein BASA81_008910 [Batrachochytrium salamandrivorans]
MLHLPFTLLVLLLTGLSDLADLANFATAKRLAGQGFHFLVLQRDGQVFAVGSGAYGQLGLNTTSDALLPQSMLSVTNATDISTGLDYSCLIDQGNQVKCTGRNDNYRLGDGTTTRRHMLVPVLGLTSGIEELYCGSFGSCVRTTSGGAQCWSFFAGLTRTSPVYITISGGIQSLSLGFTHACFVVVGDKLYCMGTNTYGQLGTGNKTSQTTPTQVIDLAAEGIVSVACGYEHTCAVNADGVMFCWGNVLNGRLGNPSITSNLPFPIQVLGIALDVASTWLGFYNSFALMQNGTVMAFGKDNYGVFGIGSTGDKTKPIVYGKGVSGVVEIRGGYPTTCVLLQNDTVWCTGRGRFGQFGVGTVTDSFTLVEMKLPTSAPTTQPTLTPNTQPTLAPIKQLTLAPHVDA